MATLWKVGKAKNKDVGFNCYFAPVVLFEKYKELQDGVKVKKTEEIKVVEKMNADLKVPEDVQTVVLHTDYIVGREKPFYRLPKKDAETRVVVRPEGTKDYFPVEKNLFDEHYEVTQQPQTEDEKPKEVKPKPKK